MNARGQWIRNPAIFCISSVCLALFVTGIGLLRAGTPEAQNAPLVVELKLDREVEPVLATYIDEGLADAALRHVDVGHRALGRQVIGAGGRIPANALEVV